MNILSVTFGRAVRVAAAMCLLLVLALGGWFVFSFYQVRAAKKAATTLCTKYHVGHSVAGFARYAADHDFFMVSIFDAQRKNLYSATKGETHSDRSDPEKILKSTDKGYAFAMAMGMFPFLRYFCDVEFSQGTITSSRVRMLD